MDTSNVLIAFLLTLFAGLSTAIGGLLVFIDKTKSYKSLSMFLGLSAGVMIYVSFMEILPDSISNLQGVYGNKMGLQLAILSFFSGMALSTLIDRLVPSKQNPHEFNKIDEKNSEMSAKNTKLLRTGMFTAVTIAIHNFPEGIASFMSAVNNPTLALPIVFAIALHNIPEGMSVSAPLYYATGSKKTAFKMSFLTGLSEPIGAIVAYFILYRFMNDVLFGIIFGMIAGIMIFISFDELLPAAQEYGEHHTAVMGVFLGMAVMAMSLVLFA